MKNLRDLLLETTVTRSEIYEVIEFEKMAYRDGLALAMGNVNFDWNNATTATIKKELSREPYWETGNFMDQFVKRAFFLKILRQNPEMIGTFAKITLRGIVEVEFIKMATAEQIKTIAKDNFRYGLNPYAEKELIIKKDKELLLFHAEHSSLNKKNVLLCLGLMNF